jgi:hypothetical protein
MNFCVYMDRLSRVVKIDARLQGEMSMKGLAVLSLGGGFSELASLLHTPHNPETSAH